MVARFTLAALRASRAWPLPAYAAALRAACRAAPPPFGAPWYADRFRRLAMDPQWIAESLIRNAEVEGEGARKIWVLAARTPDRRIAELVRRHAIDESGHALAYVALTKMLFPDALSSRWWRSLRALSPRYGPADRPRRRRTATMDQVLDEIVQMNLGEIRTRVNQMLMVPVLAAATPAANRPCVMRLMRSLLGDETRHVAYTACVLERACATGAGAFVRETMATRLAEFNALTCRQVGGGVFAGV